MPFHFTRIKNIHTERHKLLHWFYGKWKEMVRGNNQRKPCWNLQNIMLQPKTYIHNDNIAKIKWKRIGYTQTCTE